MSSLRDFIKSRLGQSESPSLADKTLPDGPRWSICLGFGLVGAIALQFITGFILALHYSPSTTTAWESVWFIEARVVYGSLIRALHHHGASLIILLAIGHALVSIWHRAYQAPREFIWWIGLGLFGVILAFALTGYLLPWDERGYSATNVATGLVAVTPVIGESLRRIVLGASDYGHLTLTRFYAVHIFLLPLSLVFLGLTHWCLRRRHGLSVFATSEPTNSTGDLVSEGHSNEAVSASEGHSDNEADSSEGHLGHATYWPNQVVANLVFTAVCLVGLAIFCLIESAPLTAPADPATSFPARPEWYFLPLYQLLHTELFSGSLEVVASHIIPTLLFMFFAAMPFIDRSRQKSGPGRKLILAVPVVTLLIALGLGVQAKLADVDNEQYKQEFTLGMERAKYAKELAEAGIPVDGAFSMLQRSERHGELIFYERCAGCHEGAERNAPILKGYLSVAWVAKLIRNPNHDAFYGRTKMGEEGAMSAFKLKKEKLESLSSYLLGVGSDESRKLGKKIFEFEDCADCHEVTEDLASTGPNLYDYGSKSWIRKVVGHPSSFLCFGAYNEMPNYHDELTKDQLSAVVNYLYQLRKQPIAAELLKSKKSAKPKETSDKK